MAKTEDRPIDEIIKAMMHITSNSSRLPEQFKRDLEKLCAAAAIGEAYMKERDKP